MMINNKTKRNELTLSNNVEQTIESSQMKLFSRIWNFIKFFGKRSYEICITAGERLAWLFGITKPKYHAEIQRYENMNEEEREEWRKAFQDIETTDNIRDSIRK